MKFTPQSIKDIVLIEPHVHKDERGYFYETFRLNSLEKGVGHKLNFVQDGEANSKMGVLRGLHYQTPPFAQSKLIRVLKGRILDVVLDIRKSSLSFGQHVAIEINSSNKNQLFIPHGFAHGYVVLSDEATILYKTDNYYSPDFEVGISPNDSQLSIDWQIPFRQLKLSDKDKALPNLADATFLYN